MREGNDGQWDRAVPLQPLELGWSGLALPPTLGQNTATCFNYIFLQGFGLLSSEQWCWLSVSYPLWSLRISLHGIISLVCDSSFYLQTTTIPEQKSPAWIAGNSTVSAQYYQGERCCPQASRTGASLLWPGWCSSSTSHCRATVLPAQGWPNPGAYHSLPATDLFQRIKTVHKKPPFTDLLNFVKSEYCPLAADTSLLVLKKKNYPIGRQPIHKNIYKEAVTVYRAVIHGLRSLIALDDILPWLQRCSSGLQDIQNITPS